MGDRDRQGPPPPGPEKDMLLGFLRYERETIVWKLDGLDEGQLRQQHAPSSLTLLGLVKHLTDVERTWFRARFAGDDDDGWDPDRHWRIGPDDTAAGLIAAYRSACAESDRIVQAHALDDVAAKTPPHRPGVTLGWILIHILQETARHVGHADLIREAIDGRTGT